MKEKALFYMLVAIAIKLSFFFFFSYQKNMEGFSQNTFYTVTGDANDYIQPVENLVEKGEHRTNNGEFALRMPGYTPVLLFFRSIFNQKWAINFTLFVQVILSGISCYILALLAFNLFSSIRLFYLVFITYTLSTYVSIWDTYVLTESFATSGLIISLYFLERSINEKNKKKLFLSSLFLAWCIFLRPYLLTLIGLYILILITQLIKTKSFKEIVRYILIFTIPIFVIEASWTIRNYVVTKEFIPLQSRISSNDGETFGDKNLGLKIIVSDFVKSFGGDHTYWNPRGTSYWFFNNNSYTTKNPFPKEIFNDTLTYGELMKIKSMCIQIESNSLSAEKESEYKNNIYSTLKTFHENYKTEQPLHFYVTSRFIHFKEFIFHTGVYNIPFPPYEQQNMTQKAAKFFYFFIYLFVFIGGGISSLYLLIKNLKKDLLKSAFFSIPFYIIFLFPLVLKVHEYRFNTLSYPFLLVGACIAVIYFMDLLLKRVKQNKITATH